MQDEIDLRIVFANMWRRKGFLFAAVAVFIGLAFFYLHFKQPRYQASSKFAVKVSEDKAAGQLRSLAALAGINVGGGSSVSPDVLFGEMLLDDDFLESVLQHKWFYKGDSVTLESIWGLAPDTTQPDWRYRFQKQRVAFLRDGGFIKLEKNKATGIIVLNTLFPSGDLARQVNEFVLRKFDESMIGSQITQAGEKKKFIDDRIQEVEKDLRRSEEALVDFQMRNKGVTVPTVLMQQARLKRDAEINQELYLQLKKQLELAKIEEKNDQPVIQIISKPVVPISPAKPNRKLVLATAILLGIFFGFMLMIAHYAYTAWSGGQGRSAQHAT